MVQIVCFDVGGVLIKLRKSWAEVCRAAGLEIRGETDSDRAEDARVQIMAPYVLGRISHEEWAERTSRALGGAYSADELSKIHDAWLLEEYEGVAALVDELRERGVPTACLSNSNHAHWALCTGGAYPSVTRLGGHFASHILGSSKPDAAMFRAFERETGHSGERVLFFDDLAINVSAARTLGWNAERIDPNGQTASQIRQQLAAYGVI
jgi:putative hydrolase of the HAD superfamily